MAEDNISNNSDSSKPVDFSNKTPQDQLSELMYKVCPLFCQYIDELADELHLVAVKFDQLKRKFIKSNEAFNRLHNFKNKIENELLQAVKAHGGAK